MSFPSLARALSVPWKNLVKRHFPLSEVYVRSRVINKFSASEGRRPGPSDVPAVSEVLRALLVENSVADSEIAMQLLAPDSILRDICLGSWGQSLPVCSVLGGFLSQEVVKAVSRRGTPMMNVFVFSSDDFVGKAFETI